MQPKYRRWLMSGLLLLVAAGCRQAQCPQCQSPERIEVAVPVTVVVTPSAAAEPGATAPSAASPILDPTVTSAPATTTTTPAAVDQFIAPAAEPYTPGPNAFIETFDGEPDQPTPWNSPNWDITVHSRDWGTWYDPVPVEADHGPGCEGPPSSHPVTDYPSSVFNCRNHMMTAINGPGYAMIYLTPNHMVDFSEQTAVIRWDMSTLRNSQRDWIDVWITPYDRNNQLTLLSWLPDLNGPAQAAVHVEMQDIVNTFNVGIIRDFADTRLRGPVHRHGYERFLEPDAARRDVFEIRISADHIRVGMPDYDFYWIDEPIDPPLDWHTGVVQFGHHSYNPSKTCDHDGSCGPTTWHWDNIIIDPALPYSIIQGDRDYINELEGQAVNFAQPAPAAAHLRFTGFSASIEVSYDNGASWQSAQRQNQFEEHNDRFQSYWMPIPAGTQTVQFRGTQNWPGGWLIRDISIWSLVTERVGDRDLGRARSDFAAIRLESRFCALPQNEPDS